jgi:hypothetical protein
LVKAQIPNSDYGRDTLILLNLFGDNRSLRFSVRELRLKRFFICNKIKERRFIMKDNNNLVRFLLTFFLGWIGSLIINHTSLKPQGYTSRTLAYFFLSIITFGIYGLVASICNLTFDPNKPKNIGYIKD